MKKILSMLLVLLVLFGSSAAMAEMGVQIIGGPETEAEPVSLDDIKMNADVEIEGYGKLNPTSFSWQDTITGHVKGSGKTWTQGTYYNSGVDAEYAILYMDILNTTTKSRNYLSNCSIKAVYDDSFEYAGWSYQFNWDISNGTEWPVHPDDVQPVDPLYVGHYCFGCTLPNAVMNGKDSLKLVITMDGNEIVYNIRK